MYKKLYNYLLSSKYFNPYGLKSEYHSDKLMGIVDGLNIMFITSKSEKWGVQLLSCQDNLTDFDDYKYVSHINFNRKPNQFQILNAANKLINKNLKS